jgi:hypothetical protein
MRLVLGQGLRLAGTGMAIGMAAVMLFGRLIESQLFEVRSASNPNGTPDCPPPIYASNRCLE